MLVVVLVRKVALEAMDLVGLFMLLMRGVRLHLVGLLGEYKTPLVCDVM